MIGKLKDNKKLYLSIFKVVVPGVLFLIVLFSMFFVSNNDKVITSLAKVFYGDNEVELDNWEISTVFYDSTVNEGRTPLTEINWDANTYTERREIKVQINYKNTNAVNQYNPNELKIEIEKLRDYNAYITPSAVSAGTVNSGYEWNYKNESSLLVFKNNNLIEHNANLEGSIQITYVLNPVVLVNGYSKELNATLKYGDKEVTTNDITFNFTSTKKEHTLNITPEKLKNFDGLPENFDDYIWVRWKLGVRSDETNIRRVRFIAPNNWAFRSAWNNIDGVYVIDHVPTNAIVLDYTMSPLENTNGKIKVTLKQDTGGGGEKFYYLKNEIYVGYPKSDYSDSTITNTVEAYGDYWDEEETSLLVEGEKQVLSSDYLFNGTVENSYVFRMFGCTSVNCSVALSRLKAGFTASTDERTYLHTSYNGTPYNLEMVYDVAMIPDTNGNYRLLDEDEYYYKGFNYYGSTAKNANGAIIKNYDMHIYIRRANNSEYELFSDTNGNTTFAANVDRRFDFTGTDIVSYKVVIEDIRETISHNVSGAGLMRWYGITLKTTNVGLSNLSPNTWAVNSGYIKIYDNNGNNLLPSIDNYENIEVNNNVTNQNYFDSSEIESIKTILEEKDQNEFGELKKRSIATNIIKNSIVKCNPNIGYTPNFYNDNKMVDYPLEGKFKASIKPLTRIQVSNGMTKNFKGIKQYMLLPEGMSYEKFEYAPERMAVKTKSGVSVDATYLNEHVDIDLENNYKNSNRTLITITHDFSDDPIDLTSLSENEFRLSSLITVSVNYDNYIDYGDEWNVNYFVDLIDRESIDYEWGWWNGGKSEEVDGKEEPYDFNNNNQIDKLFASNGKLIIVSAVSTNQDAQVSVQSDLSNFNTGKVNTSNNSEYSYKLRVRTGTNDVTNLVIYDSLEKYAKDSNMANVLASGGRKSWQGEFLGIDTSYAESKGYTVRTYYSENETPGSIHDDDSWILYTDSVDKSKVKSLAFEHLDSNGNPAILPANSLTYVLIRMKSPADEELKTLAYNGCWTEWNAIDPITNQTVDFITGINSNIVKVALPKSVEPVDIDLEINKYWSDKNNSLGIRPDTINIQVVPNGDVTKAIDVPIGTTNVVSGNSNRWKTSVSVPKYDEDGEIINYTLREGEIILEDGYKYTPTIEDNTVTNTLVKEIELKKIWNDNANAYLTRPGSVMYVIKQNGNDYKEVTFTGDYSANEWSKKITVPVFDSSNNEYTYTVSEIVIDGYTPNCSGLVCTNTLSGTKNIIITKEWNDKNNEYNTRPDNIKVNLLRNGTLYQEVTVSGSNWNSNNIEVPLYDENGVKYNYTISEDSIDEYGLVEYDQNNYKITNSLKKKINLVIKKIWVDDNNSNNTRPNELSITLLRDGENYQTVTLTGDGNEWSTTVEVDKYDSNFNKYKYSIKEVNDSISDLYNNVTYSENELTVTNTLGELTNLTISKKWIDHNNEYMTRPESIKVNLLQDGIMYKEVTISKDKEWKEIISNIPVYDSNQNRHIYTIEESVSIPKYNKVTYDQTNLEITNELTEVPTVSLYFTVVNGYVDPVTGEMKYDDFGLNEILRKYNKTVEDEYIFTFELKNLDSGKLYDGKLSTQGILEFKDIPYGDYKAVEGEDKLFDFVDMLSIEEVNGVSFRREGKEGYISIRPTGENIVFGAKIVNKISPPIDNPNTGIVLEIIVLLILLIPVSYSMYLLSKKIKTN